MQRQPSVDQRCKDTTLTLQSSVTLVNPITNRREPINQTKTAKLLGFQIDNHMSFNKHVSSVIEKLVTFCRPWPSHFEETWCGKLSAHQNLLCAHHSNTHICHTLMVYLHNQLQQRRSRETSESMSPYHLPNHTIIYRVP